MISQKNRFHGHNSVSKVRGSTINSSSLSLRFQKSNRPDFRLAVVVSKKVAPNAVMRNRIRRRIFEIVRKSKQLENVGVDVVIYIKTDQAATVISDILEQEVLATIRKSLSRL